MDLHTRVVKEPRGFIRVIQLVFAIFAFATTSGFNGKSALDMFCPDKEESRIKTRTYDFPIEYPFQLEKNEFKYISNCTMDYEATKQFPMDFSSSARFYVTTGVLCMLYCIGALVFYMFSASYYATNPLIPVLDLIATGILTIFWFAGACAWAAGVSDLKYYTNPSYFKKYIPFCKDPDACATNKVANWSSLNVSLIFGFANVFLWGASMWFVYKETSFHPKPVPPMPPGGMPPQQASFGGYGDPIGTQPKSTTQYPNVQQPQQFTGQY